MRKKGLSFANTRRKKIDIGVFKEIASWLFWIVISAFVAVVLVFVFGTRTNIIGDSMEPNLYAGQQILINKLIYEISSPKRGDIVAFQPNGNKSSHYYVKRVIGLPGESVQIINGYVYIDGVYYDEGGKHDKIADPGIAENEVILGADEYFVLGDNRNFSEDSRSGNIGPVKKDYMIGKIWFRLSMNLEYFGFISYR